MVDDIFSFISLDNDDFSIQENKARELARFYPRDENKEDLIKKVRHFNTTQKTIYKQGNLMQLLNQIFEKKLECLFHFICIMPRIFNTTPVSVTEGERSFSKLKIVKISLRSTTDQNCVTDFLIISIDEDLAKKVSNVGAIDIWATRKARKINLLASYSPFSKFLLIILSFIGLKLIS